MRLDINSIGKRTLQEWNNATKTVWVRERQEKKKKERKKREKLLEKRLIRWHTVGIMVNVWFAIKAAEQRRNDLFRPSHDTESKKKENSHPSFSLSQTLQYQVSWWRRTTLEYFRVSQSNRWVDRQLQGLALLKLLVPLRPLVCRNCVIRVI